MLNHEQLLRLMREKVEHPATPRELQQRLKIPREQRSTLSKLLKELTGRGDLVETRGNRYGLPDRMNLVVGRVTTHPRGFGFVSVDRAPDPVSRRSEKPPRAASGRPVARKEKDDREAGPVWKGDLYIAGSNLSQAMHGDRVVARVERIGSDGRAEGRIVRILER